MRRGWVIALLLAGCAAPSATVAPPVDAPPLPAGAHALTLLDEPDESVVWPVVDAPLLFLAIPIADAGDDTIVTIAVIVEDEAETLFIDTNNDNDLNTDGIPDFFPRFETTFDFEVQTPGGPQQLRLQRASVLAPAVGRSSYILTER
ncbi:MAG: hypothetical protein RhofKO_28780 [Rhodothermales bacterium]